ncbi:MAG: Glycosyl transferase group 1, partial [uncultured bacterium]
MKTVVDAQSIVLNRSGVGRYTFNLLKAFACLKKEEHKIIPFFFNFRRKFNEQDVWKRNPGNMVEPCEIRLIPGFILHQLWMRLPLFPLDLFTSNADVFHFPNYLMKPVSKGKIILTVHDMAFLRYPETLMKKNLRMLKQGFNKSLEKSDAIITVSEFSKNEFHYFYPLYKKPVYVTHNGIDEFLNLKFDSDLNEKICLKYKLP